MPHHGSLVVLVAGVPCQLDRLLLSGSDLSSNVLDVGHQLVAVPGLLLHLSAEIFNLPPHLRDLKRVGIDSVIIVVILHLFLLQ